MTTAKESNKVVEETSKVHNVVSQFGKQRHLRSKLHMLIIIFQIDGEGETSNLKASTVPESEDSSKLNNIPSKVCVLMDHLNRDQ